MARVGSNERTPGLTRPVPRRWPLQLRSHWPIRGWWLFAGVTGGRPPRWWCWCWLSTTFEEEGLSWHRESAENETSPARRLSISPSTHPVPLRKPPDQQPGHAGQSRFPKTRNRKKGKEKKQTQRKEKAGLLGPFSLPTGPHAFLSTSPAVSIFITTAVQEDHQSACMVGWGWDARRLSAAAREDSGFQRDETRCDAMVPVTECWPTERDDACWPFGGNHRWL